MISLRVSPRQEIQFRVDHEGVIQFQIDQGLGGGAFVRKCLKEAYLCRSFSRERQILTHVLLYFYILKNSTGLSN